MEYDVFVNDVDSQGNVFGAGSFPRESVLVAGTQRWTHIVFKRRFFLGKISSSRR